MAAVMATRRNPTDKMFYQWLVGGGKSQERGSHCLYTETADQARYDVHAPDALADGTASARWTVKTVADTFSYPSVLRNPVREMRAGRDQPDTPGGEKSGPLTIMVLFRVPGLVPAP